MSDTIWTEFLIQQRLIWFLRGMDYIVPNMWSWRFEMDLFFVRPSGYSEEIEIKCTMRDFKADRQKAYKHDIYKRSYEGQESIQKYVLPNRFSYAVPDGLGITEKDVPEYAGLYIVNGGVLRQKWPPFLHKKKRDLDKRIAKSTCPRLLYAKGYYIRYKETS